ncbi:MAG: hypothetical protein J6P53_02200, partial [Mailhella sp.]|nr:hypothetical protein [Mailhella sp.]
RIVTLQRAFTHREAGVGRETDTLPPRMFDAMPEGPGAGKKWTMEEIRKTQDTYYAFYGWDDNGVPTEKCLKEYGLDFCLDSLKA